LGSRAAAVAAARPPPRRGPPLGPSARRMAAAAAGGMLQDLFDDLDRSSAAGRRASADVRPDRGPRITHAEDEVGPGWRPPPANDDVKRLMQAESRRDFVRFGKQAGTDFEPPCTKRMKPALLSMWAEERKGVPDRSFAKTFSTIKFSAEPLPEPHAGLCNKRHQEWLAKHAKARDKHTHPVYYALERVKKGEERLASHEFKRQLTRDMLSRPAALTLPDLQGNAKKGLGRAKTAIATSRFFKQAVGVDILAQEETADEALLARMKSAPALALRPPTPQGRAKHLRNWAGPDRTVKCFRESTPWREHDEERALRTRRVSQNARTR